MAFSSLNKRISLILSSTQLHVIISKLHCRYQLKILSSHLTNHARKVISLSLEDKLRDRSSVIPFLFKQHTFINLRSCEFFSICSSSKLDHAIEQLTTLTKLQSFRIQQSHSKPLSDQFKRKLTETILKHKLSNLHSIKLIVRYDYPYLATNITINWTLTLLSIMFYGSSNLCSIYSILSILRTYRVLRKLYVTIIDSNESNTHHANTKCDFDSLNRILRYMPNLHQFIISIENSRFISSSWNHLLNGHNWQQLLTNYLPHLDVFDLFITVFIHRNSPVLDMKAVVHSFEYFSAKYDDWSIKINQSRFSINRRTQQVELHALRCSKALRYQYVNLRRTVLDTINIYSTAITNAQMQAFYYGTVRLQIDIPLNSTFSNNLLMFSPYQNINDLVIRIEPLRTSLWNTMTQLIGIYDTHIERMKQKEYFDQLARLVDLNYITTLEFDPMIDLSQLYFIEQVLLTSPNMIYLTIPTRLFLSRLIFDSPSLIDCFRRLQSLNVTSEHVNFTVKDVLKLIEKCLLLIHIELRSFSFDICLSIVDILLGGLSNLIHMKIYFNTHILCNNPCSIDYIVGRRHRIFPYHICKKNEIYVKVHRQYFECYLSGCSICAKGTCYV
ncbi:unnamed protein product [Rotaria sordida]|uniref:Uncharacterized protein n=2 Tax=Rotaria sordida TaxID=392033 RepID=A0A819SRW2_9BILA|nr:unnamed protein product [Rotaria sordida]